MPGVCFAIIGLDVALRASIFENNELSREMDLLMQPPIRRSKTLLSEGDGEY